MINNNDELEEELENDEYYNLDDMDKSRAILGDKDLSMGDIANILSGDEEENNDVDVSLHGHNAIDILDERDNQRTSSDGTINNLYKENIDATGAVERPDFEEELSYKEKGENKVFSLRQKLEKSLYKLEDYAEHDEKLGPKYEYITNSYYRVSSSDTLKKLSQSEDELISTALVIDPAVLPNARKTISNIIEHISNASIIIGIQPSTAINRSDYDITQLQSIIDEFSGHIVAIGSIGFTDSNLPESKDIQTRFMSQQIEIAIKNNLPLLFTNKSNSNEFYDCISKFDINECVYIDPIETEEQVTFCEEHNASLLLRTDVTYGRYEFYRSVIRSWPKEKILVGSGTDNLAIQDKAGRWNDPSDVRVLLKLFAELKNLNDAEAQYINNKNFLDLYKQLK